MDNNILGERIRELREQAGMSQLELANKLGISRTAIARYEGGVASPSRRLKVLADALDVSVDYLLNGAGEYEVSSHPTGIGKRIQLLRTLANMDKRTLAVRCGVNTRAVTAWEEERSAPSLTAVAIMADVLKASTDYILGRAKSSDATPAISRLVTDMVEQVCTKDPAFADKLRDFVLIDKIKLDPVEMEFFKSYLLTILRLKGLTY